MSKSGYKGGNPKPNDARKNLRVPTSEQARAQGSIGGKRSGEVRKEKKLLSQIYMEALAKLENAPEGKTLSDIVVNLARGKGKPVQVAMLKEIGSLTEGQKVKLGGDEDNKAPVSINIVGVAPQSEN